jgi:DNA-directed RNA polymerase specialized sigma24 family protein
VKVLTVAFHQAAEPSPLDRWREMKQCISSRNYSGFTENYRELIRLRDIDGFSYDEISKRQE